MTLPQALELFQYWKAFPPEHELVQMFARVYTTWKPEDKPMTEEEQRAAHQASLEARWKAGAMNPAQIMAAMGGAKAVAIGVDGLLRPASPVDMSNGAAS
jgi:hypothetical protein